MPVYDPFSFSDPFDAPFQAGRRRVAAYPPLPEPEARSAIADLTDAGLSGLGYVGSTLDKLFGGRAVRGVLGGNAREALSALPGSDLMGLTDASESVSGEDLLRNMGYDPSQGNWIERNLVGPAAEIVLDPSTYLGGIGALSKAGKAARGQGTLTKGLLPAVRAGERSLMYGLTGPAVADAAEGVASAIGKANVGLRKLPGVAPAEDFLAAAGEKARLSGNALFDRASGPVANDVVQRASREVREPARVAGVEEARRQAFRLYGDIQPALDAGADPEHVYRYLTEVGELGAPRNVPAPLVPHLPHLDAAVQRIKPLYAAMPAAEEALGLKSPRLGSAYDVDYMMRRAVKAPSAGGAGAATEKTFRVTHPSQLRRKDIFDVPGGTVQLEDWIRDPSMSGQARTLAKKDVRDAILDEHMGWAGGLTTGTLPINFPKVARRKSSGLANYLGDVKDEYIDLPGRAEPTVPFFSRDVPANYLARATRGAEVGSAAEAVHDVIGRVGAQGVGDVPATRVLAKAGLRGEGAYRRALEALGQDPNAIVATAQAAANAPVDPAAALRAELKGFLLPAEEAKAATKYMNRYTTPEEIGPVKRLLDSSLNLYKAGLYSIFPASHGRNFLSGVYENAMEGTSPFSPAIGDARRLLKGEAPDLGLPHLAGLTPDQQRSAFLEEMFAKGIVGQPQGEFNTRVGVRESEVGAGNPALPRKGIAASAAQALDRRSLTDLAGVAGVGGRQVDTNPLVRAGRDIGSTVEDNLRSSQYLDLRRKGFTPDAARDMVKRTHFDYGDLSDFEKEYARRLSLFYTFPRKNVPKQVGRAVSEPAKTLAPLRLSGSMEGDEGYVPEYLRSGLALPLGGEEDGTQTYLSGVGLPFEEAFSRLKVGDSLPETAQQTGLGLLGALRPELKGPLEFLTGKQFFTGRDLADLEPGKVASLGGMLDPENARLLSQFLANSPASRAVSTANRLLDERKHTPEGVAGLLGGLATGLRVTDVDTGKWKAIDARHALEENLRDEEGVSEMINFYVKPGDKAAISPEQEEMLRLNAYLVAKARAAAQQKRRIGVQAQP